MKYPKVDFEDRDTVFVEPPIVGTQVVLDGGPFAVAADYFRLKARGEDSAAQMAIARAGRPNIVRSVIAVVDVWTRAKRAAASLRRIEPAAVTVCSVDKVNSNELRLENESDSENAQTTLEAHKNASTFSFLGWLFGSNPNAEPTRNPFVDDETFFV